jgi:hemin uptake protein HemP
MQAMTPTRPQPLPQPTARQTSSDIVRAVDLLRDRQVLVIEHAGERYQLRLTRNGKLLLTK